MQIPVKESFLGAAMEYPVIYLLVLFSDIQKQVLN